MVCAVAGIGLGQNSVQDSIHSGPIHPGPKWVSLNVLPTAQNSTCLNTNLLYFTSNLIFPRVSSHFMAAPSTMLPREKSRVII